MLQSTNFWFGEDAEIIFCRGISSFSGRSEGFKFLMPFCTTNNFGDEAAKLMDRHMLGEAMVVDPVRAIPGIFNELRVF